MDEEVKPRKQTQRKIELGNVVVVSELGLGVNQPPAEIANDINKVFAWLKTQGKGTFSFRREYVNPETGNPVKLEVFEQTEFSTKLS